MAVKFFRSGQLNCITIIDPFTSNYLSSKDYGLITDHIPYTVKAMLISSEGTAAYVLDFYNPSPGT